MNETSLIVTYISKKKFCPGLTRTLTKLTQKSNIRQVEKYSNRRKATIMSFGAKPSLLPASELTLDYYDDRASQSIRNRAELPQDDNCLGENDVKNIRRVWDININCEQRSLKLEKGGELSWVRWDSCYNHTDSEELYFNGVSTGHKFYYYPILLKNKFYFVKYFLDERGTVMFCIDLEELNEKGYHPELVHEIGVVAEHYCDHLYLDVKTGGFWQIARGQLYLDGNPMLKGKKPNKNGSWVWFVLHDDYYGAVWSEIVGPSSKQQKFFTIISIYRQNTKKRIAHHKLRTKGKAIQGLMMTSINKTQHLLMLPFRFQLIFFIIEGNKTSPLKTVQIDQFPEPEFVIDDFSLLCSKQLIEVFFMVFSIPPKNRKAIVVKEKIAEKKPLAEEEEVDVDMTGFFD